MPNKADRRPDRSPPPSGARLAHPEFETAGNPRSLFAIALILLIGWWLMPGAPEPRSAPPAADDAQRGVPPANPATAPTAAPQAAPPAARRGFRKLEGVYADSMDIDLAPDRSLWITSKYTLLRVAENGAAELLLDGSGYRRVLGNSPLRAWSSGLATQGGQFWLGGWYGELLHYADGQWRQRSPHDAAPAGRVRDLLETGEGLWIAAADGLWRLGDGDDAPQAIAGFEDQHIVALAELPQAGLFAASERALYRRHPGGWLPVWSPPAGDRISMLAARDEGSLYVGRQVGGLLRLTEHGEVRAQALKGRHITAIASDGAGGLWVASWDAGLWWLGPGGWKNHGADQGLATNSISALAVRGDSLWLALYGEGAVWAPLDEARALMQ